jgi:sec-independent protein translocase protein TatA
MIGLPEILILVVIILILFGPGRISKTAGELGKGIKAFKDGLSGDDEKEEKKENVEKKVDKKTRKGKNHNG